MGIPVQQSLLLQRTFLPLAARFLYRHPMKIPRLRRLWREHVEWFKTLSQVSGQALERLGGVYLELHKDIYFRQLKRWTGSEIEGWPGVPPYAYIYYTLVRAVKPEVVVETGVEHGVSSQVILLAMNRNGRGALHSIDLPNQDVVVDQAGKRQRDIMPNGCETGWVVQPHLRNRWHLHLGDAKEILPNLLSTLGSIDIFIHDSLHSYEHMWFEFRTAWPHLRSGGLLLSDDISWNTAFSEFARQVNSPAQAFKEQAGTAFAPRTGVIRKRM